VPQESFHGIFTILMKLFVSIDQTSAHAFSHHVIGPGEIALILLGKNGNRYSTGVIIECLSGHTGMRQTLAGCGKTLVLACSLA
jgi:hypothetical protein